MQKLRYVSSKDVYARQRSSAKLVTRASPYDHARTGLYRSLKDANSHVLGRVRRYEENILGVNGHVRCFALDDFPEIDGCFFAASPFTISRAKNLGVPRRSRLCVTAGQSDGLQSRYTILLGQHESTRFIYLAHDIHHFSFWNCNGVMRLD